MIHHFSESFSKASLLISQHELLQTYRSEKQIQKFTFVRATSHLISLRIDRTLHTLQPNEILSLTPTQHLQYISGNGGIVYQFNREFYCIKDHDKEVNCMGIVFYAPTPKLTIKLNSKDVEKLNQVHSDLEEEFQNSDSIQAEMLRLLIKNFIIRITRILKTQQTNLSQSGHKQDLLRKFTILVEENYKTEHQVSFYANQLFKASKTLSNNFNHFHTSPLQIIQDRIVMETKRLIIYSDLSFKEIALELGYSDVAQWSKLFKKTVGNSPSEFKKQQQFTQQEKLTN